MDKPKIDIVLSDTEDAHILRARQYLSHLKDEVSYHESRDVRHPLGVYNLSVTRICDKIVKCAEHLLAYWESGQLIDQGSTIIDYLELATYAAAEHVDDIGHIAYTLFKSDREASQSAKIRLLNSRNKNIRDEISCFANVIKHNHGRVRLFETTFCHEKKKIKLLGFYVEGFANGAAGPTPILHKEMKVVSVTSWLWNILTYVWEMSESLSDFLQDIGAVKVATGEASKEQGFRKTITALVQLPLYSFDDIHPFNRVAWSVTVDHRETEVSSAQIYGSISHRWSDSTDGTFEGWKGITGGDGVTCTFSVVQPKKMGILHWTTPLLPSIEMET